MFVKKKLIAAAAALLLLGGAFCACSDEDAALSSAIESRDEYSVSIAEETDKEVAYEYNDGGIEVYYITFGCDVDGVRLERLDENGQPAGTLCQAEAISKNQCFKLSTTVPEGMPNTLVVVTCGESEHEYQLAYNGRDGGADLIEQEAM